MRSNGAATGVEEPLVDLTVAIPLRSKRTERKQKKLQEKAQKDRTSLLDLPSDLILEILGHLRPSDIYIVLQISKPLRQFILQNEANIIPTILQVRYSALSRCFRPPVLLANVDECGHQALQGEERTEFLKRHKKPYQHIKGPDPQLICTCWSCMLAWNYLCLIVDFAKWQDNLDKGNPIPMIPRGTYPKWNQNLIAENARVVEKALHSPLAYSRLLEQHLRSTVGSIRRHANNKGNKRSRFRMSGEDAASETDVFLERSGPPSVDFPFHRDNYYMLEAYLPNRGWSQEESRWLYLPALHDRDLEMVKARATKKQTSLRTLQRHEECPYGNASIVLKHDLKHQLNIYMSTQ